jgi:hypothetical protein
MSCDMMGTIAAPRQSIVRGTRATRRYIEAMRRILLNVVGVLCVLMGCVWFLQGINVIPGSFMTGQSKWAIIGGLLFIVGVSLLVAANPRRQV